MTAQGSLRLTTMFDELSAKRAALIAYAMGSYPDRDRSVEVILTMLDNGADAVEIGIPFSDPVMDGPLIREAGEAALGNGTTPLEVFEVASEVRGSTDRPLLLMTYYNIIFRMGSAEFIRRAAQAGVDGIVVPDLPTDEMRELRQACDGSGVAIVAFCSLTTTPERIREADRVATGFLYCVSRLGTTGVRDTIPDTLPGFLARVKANAAGPIAAGIGVSTPEQCASIGALADGVIVGSALVERVRVSNGDLSGLAGLVASMSGSLRDASRAEG
jgi:tryptophan synthase alpha chain